MTTHKRLHSNEIKWTGPKQCLCLGVQVSLGLNTGQGIAGDIQYMFLEKHGKCSQESISSNGRMIHLHFDCNDSVLRLRQMPRPQVL